MKGYVELYSNVFQIAVVSAEYSIMQKEAKPSKVSELDWLHRSLQILNKIQGSNGRVFFIGNGASASIASHYAADFCKTLKIDSTILHDPAFMTCFSNDYSYEDAFCEMLKVSFRPGDCLVSISSSGSSRNILNATTYVREQVGGSILTFSGFSEDNPLRSLGDANVYVPNDVYGIVESAHSLFLHVLLDRMTLGDFPEEETS